MSNHYTLFGIDIAIGSREELYQRCAALVGRGGAISTVNPIILNNAINSPELKEALKSSLCIPDGVGVEIAIRCLGCKTERLPGVDLGEQLLSGDRCVSLGIIGGKEGVATKALENLTAKHPGVIPEFALCGYNIDDGYVKKLISERQPDVVFVCLGSPMQELFVNRMRPFSEKTLFLALGGSADIYSGEKKRAPGVIRMVGAEWLWRILREPKRLAKVPGMFSFFIKTAEYHRKSGKIGKKTDEINR